MSEVAKIVAANLERLRAFEPGDLSQAEFARRLGIHQRTYNRIVSGAVEASLETIEQAAKRLRLQPWQLLVEDFHAKAPPQLAGDATTAEIYAHLRAATRLIPPEV